ncbi:cell division inhibition protein DicB, partial [Escherichia coli]
KICIVSMLARLRLMPKGCRVVFPASAGINRNRHRPAGG